ncbi:MAG: hypothetical protein WDZ60_01095, partial [Wenzhouxiangellaceae bacterium]
CVAIIVQESIWIGLDLLDPARALNRQLAEAPLADGWLTPLLVAWLVGGVFGGLMATLVGRSRYSGHAAGLLLSSSALLIAAISLPGAGALLVIAATPSLGAAFGAGIGVSLLDGEGDGLVRPSLVTLRSGFS